MSQHTSKHHIANPDESQAAKPAGQNVAAPVLKRFQTDKPAFRSTTDEERKFYQGRPWRTFRAAHKQAQWLLDLKRASELVERHPALGASYTAWLKTRAPLCEVSFAAGLIVPATVLDHIRPIRQGGAVWSKNNLQWLCESEHNRKSGRK